MCDWITLLYNRKLTEHCKLAIMEKKNHYKAKKNHPRRSPQNLVYHKTNYSSAKDCKYIYKKIEALISRYHIAFMYNLIY